MKLGRPLSPDEEIAVLGARPEPGPVLGEPIDLSSLSMHELWNLAQGAPDDLRHEILQSMYGQQRRLEKPTIQEKVGHGAQKGRRGVQELTRQVSDWFTGEDTAEPIRRAWEDEHALYERGRGPDAGPDYASMVGEIGSLSPLIPFVGALGAGRGLLAESAGSAAGSGLLSALPMPGRGETRLGNAGVGMITGAAVPPILAGASAAGGYLGSQALQGLAKAADIASPPLPSRSVVRPSGAIDLQPLESVAQRQMTTGGLVSPEIVQRQKLLTGLGFTDESAPMRGQLTRNPAEFAEEQNLAKLGGEGMPGEPVLNRLMAQDERFKGLAGEMVSRTGAKLAGPGKGEIAAEPAIEAIHKWAGASQKEVGGLYDEIERTVGDFDGVNFNRLIGEAHVMSDTEPFRPVTNSLFNILKRRGIVGDDGLPTGKTLTLNQARSIRQTINDIPAAGSLRHAKQRIIKFLDDDVIDSTGNDHFKVARDAARERFRQIETKLVGQILDDNLQPNQMMNRARLHSTKRLEEMRYTLTNAGPDGVQAWNEIRGQLLYETLNKNVNGAGALTAQFVKDLDKLGEKKMRFLWPELYDQLQQTKEAVEVLRVVPERSAINFANTAVTLMNWGSKLPGVREISNLAPAQAISSAIKKAGQQRAADAALHPDLMNELARQALQGRITGAFQAKIPGTRLSAGRVLPLLPGPMITSD